MRADGYTERTPPQAREYWGMLGQHKWWIFLSTLVLACASMVVISFLPDHYRAATTILVDPQTISERYVNSTVTTTVAERLNMISQEVLSATRLQKIIDELQLYPELRKSSSREEIIDYMQKSIKIQVKEGSGLSAFTITYEGKDPVAVAQVANMLASSFMEWNLRSREQQATGTTEFLAAHLQEAKNALEEQENRLREFRVKHLGETPDQLQGNLQTLSGLRTALQANADALNRLDEERTLLTRLPENEPKSGAAPGPASKRARLESEKHELEELLAKSQQRYTPLHPDMEALRTQLQTVTKELQNLPPPPTTTSQTASVPPSATAVRLQIIDREMERLKKEQTHINSQIALYQARVEAEPLREQQMVDLTRNYEISKQHYDSLLEKTYGAEMASDLERKQKAEHFTILDPARVPAKPFKPRRIPLMAGSGVMALAFSLGLAILREMLNTTIKMERELKAILPPSVPLIAWIPRIETGSDRRRQVWAAILAVAVSLLVCLMTAGLLWKVRPNL